MHSDAALMTGALTIAPTLHVKIPFVPEWGSKYIARLAIRKLNKAVRERYEPVGTKKLFHTATLQQS